MKKGIGASLAAFFVVVLTVLLTENMQELSVQQLRNKENSRVPREQLHSHKM